MEWLLVTLAWDKGGVTVNGVDLYPTLEACEIMGNIATAWFGVDWSCVVQYFV